MAGLLSLLNVSKGIYTQMDDAQYEPSEDQLRDEGPAVRAKPVAHGSSDPAQKYPEFPDQIKARHEQQVANIRVQMTPDAVATVAGMRNLIADGDIDGALSLLEQCAQRFDKSGDPQNASVTRYLAYAISTDPLGADAFAKRVLNSGDILAS